jgi:hypothetical protein
MLTLVTACGDKEFPAQGLDKDPTRRFLSVWLMVSVYSVIIWRGAVNRAKGLEDGDFSLDTGIKRTVQWDGCDWKRY